MSMFDLCHATGLEQEGADAARDSRCASGAGPGVLPRHVLRHHRMSAQNRPGDWRTCLVSNAVPKTCAAAMMDLPGCGVCHETLPGIPMQL